MERLHVIGDLALKRLHALDIHVTGASDKVSFIVILARELIADQMAAVVKIDVLDDPGKIRCLSAGGLDHADLPTFFCRHEILADCRIGGTTASKVIERAVEFNYFVRVFCEKWRVPVDLDIG